MNICFIQARLNSSRLPGKVMMDLCGKSVIQHIYNRVKKAKLVDHAVVVTGDKDINWLLYDYCRVKHIPVVCGEQDNVLKRYYDSFYKIYDMWFVTDEAGMGQRVLDTDNIIRITADCPLTDPKVIDRVIKAKKKGMDYIGNQRTYIDGYDVEVFTVGLLKEMYEKYKFDEHATLKFKQNEPHRLNYIDDKKDFSKIHLSLDTEYDYKIIKMIYDKFYKKNPYFGYEEVKRWLLA